MRKSLIKRSIFPAAVVAAVFAFTPGLVPFALAEDKPKPAQSESSEQLDFASGLFSRKMYKMAADEYKNSYHPIRKTRRSRVWPWWPSRSFIDDYRSATGYDEYLKRFALDKDAVTLSCAS